MTHSWSVAGGGVACQVALADGALTWRLTGDAPGLDTAPAPLSAIEIDGKPVTWTGVDQKRLDTSPDGVRTLTIEAHSAEGLALIQTIEAFSDRPFVRLSATLFNRGVRPDPVQSRRPTRDRHRLRHPVARGAAGAVVPVSRRPIQLGLPARLLQ